jgi:hypothetical protein
MLLKAKVRRYSFIEIATSESIYTKPYLFRQTILKGITMNTSLKKLTTIALSAMFVFTLAACSEGPAEDAGEKLDEVVTDAGNAIEDACEDVKENADAEDKDC